MKNYIFYYFMNEQIEAIKTVAPTHANHWKPFIIKGGPFKDFSGGFIVFEAIDENEATRHVSSDPFVKEELLSQSWLKEWLN